MVWLQGGGMHVALGVPRTNNIDCDCLHGAVYNICLSFVEQSNDHHHAQLICSSYHTIEAIEESWAKVPVGRKCRRVPVIAELTGPR